MAYAPGSFSKNFAWHGTGLRKLHTTIRSGFHDVLAPIGRRTFRSDAGVDGAIVLIPINFFLHNRDGHISIDELVFQAIERDHSPRFDRLALFALNLSRVGGGRDPSSGREIAPRPAMWANEFVRERLWSQGMWLTSALRDASLDQFLTDRMVAQDDVRVKCRNNYRHMFKLCGYLSSRLSMINSGAEQWIGSALFLAWDRHILDGGAQDKSNLLGLIQSDELYKLLGVSRDYALAQADALADLYETVGRLNRFMEGAKAPPSDVPAAKRPAVDLSEEVGLQWLEQEESDGVVERKSVERKEQVRDRRKAAALKRHYDNTCQFCGARLQVAEGHFYSEAAHIKGLGEPHNGPDTTSNMLVLCPNHHLQFDRGVLSLHKVGNEYRILSKTSEDPLQGETITLTHTLEDQYVRHHYDWFS